MFFNSHLAFLLIDSVTRQLADFFDGFRINKLCVSITKLPQTELLSLVKAPARIIHRRKTTAVDEPVTLEQILDPPPIQPIEPIRAARVVIRRKTTGDRDDIDLDTSFKELLTHPAKLMNDASQPLETPVEKYVQSNNAEPPSCAQSNARECANILQSKSPTQKTKKPLPELIPIRNELTIASENSQESVPNLALEPLAYVEYIRKKIARMRGVLSDQTNVVKK